MAFHYSPKIVTDGLVLYLDVANSRSYNNGQLLDLSKNLYDPVLTGSPAYSATYSGSLLFDNIDDLITTGTTGGLNLNTLGATRNFTVMFGAKKTHYGTGGNNVGNSNLFMGASLGYNDGWRIQEYSLGTPGNPFNGNMSWSFGSPMISSSISIADTSNRFSICAFSQNGPNVLAFLNGKTQSSTTFGAYVNGVNSGKIGPSEGGVGRFAGYFSFICIYNRSLSEKEISQNYNALKSRFDL